LLSLEKASHVIHTYWLRTNKKNEFEVGIHENHFKIRHSSSVIKPTPRGAHLEAIIEAKNFEAQNLSYSQC